MMKKILSVILAMSIIAVIGAGCAKQKLPGDNFEDEKSGLRIVTTNFPAYDWARELSADTENEIILLGENVDIHNYKPSAADIVSIGEADVFIYTGGESEDWVEDAVASSGTNAKVVSFTEMLGPLVKEEVAIPGAEPEGDEMDEDETEYDEHTWLSIGNASVIVDRLAAVFSMVDESHRVVYDQNKVDYAEKLEELGEEYDNIMTKANRKVLVFADRFPFRYLADDYGLECYAAFSGCSAQAEASFETVAFLAEQVDKYQLGTIYHIDNGDTKIAETVRENTQNKAQKIVSLNSMQGKQSNDATYLNIMEDNLMILSLDLLPEAPVPLNQ